MRALYLPTATLSYFWFHFMKSSNLNSVEILCILYFLYTFMATCVVLCAFHRAKPSDPLATFWDKVGLGITGLSNKSFCKEWVATRNVEFLHLIYKKCRFYSILVSITIS